VDGMEVTKDNPLRCEDCILANQKRRPFDGNPGGETNPLERVYVDIFGPTRVPSVGGSTYAMVIVDGGTARKTSYFSSNRTADTTIGHLNDFRIKAERQTGYK
ncbi:hypothetical protein F5050DRAFT_1557913, partial [Lentinula boryana]